MEIPLKARKALLAAALLPLGLGGCDGVTDPVICTAIAVSSLNVTVRDQATSQRICDATVVAVRGGVPFDLRRAGTGIPEGCTYAGPEERAGAFEVLVTRTGYETATARAQVNADECHVIPVQLTIDLRRSP
jgi:hypothetical protein